MKTMKYSRQREMIYNTLMENRVHPTAEYVYNCLKADNPQLSLGTVYRNLQVLADSGQILRLSIPDQADRFDGDISAHYHMKCSKCGELTDIFVDYLTDVDKMIERETGNRITSHNILFNGICRECNTAENEGERNEFERN